MWRAAFGWTFDITFGGETCSATGNFDTNSAFVLARRKTIENLDEDKNIHCFYRLSSCRTENTVCFS